MRRLVALIRKECLQIVRDPSAILVAFVLPVILLFIYGYGVNLDSNKVKLGLVVQDRSVACSSLIQAFTDSRFFSVVVGHDTREFANDLTNGRLRGIVVIPSNFTRSSMTVDHFPTLQVITDGSEPNIASFVKNYVQGVVQVWQRHQIEDRSMETTELISIESRFWYNQELKSRNFLIPGSIAIIMTLIGTLLTAFVIAREWERGSMESLMATPVTIIQILIGKLIPYFFLALCSLILCWWIATSLYHVPFRGTFGALLAVTTVFLFGALGQGLLISSITKSQLVASQLALISGFLPSFMLSGFIFDIAAMPKPIQLLTYIFPARYYVTCLQTLFLTGNVWPLLLRCMAAMFCIGSIFFIITTRKTKKRLD